MDIRMGSLLDGAREAVGTVVVIDVFRAFTTAAVAFTRGAEKIILVGEIEDALALKAQGAGELLVGEVEGKRPAGFDHNNSPFEICRTDLKGKTLIQSTRAGTVGVEAATGADMIYTGAFVNALATAEAIRAANSEIVTLVAMGWGAKRETEEDTSCARYLAQLLQGDRPDVEAFRSPVLATAESRKFDDPAQPHFHPRDRDIALSVDTVPFAIRVDREDDLLVARREAVPHVEAELLDSVLPI
jgi:2-phosphosulfolactate phosphatase